MYLTAETKKTLEKTLGKSIADISKMNSHDELEFVKRKSGTLPHFSKDNKRICTIQDIDRWIAELR